MSNGIIHPELMNKVWNSEGTIGYKQITTFFSDFSIADAFGIDAIKDTYKRVMEEWKDNYKYLTELVMVLNAKCWQFAEKIDEYCELYTELFYEAQGYALDNLKGDDFSYFCSTTD